MCIGRTWPSYACRHSPAFSVLLRVLCGSNTGRNDDHRGHGGLQSPGLKFRIESVCDSHCGGWRRSILQCFPNVVRKQLRSFAYRRSISQSAVALPSLFDSLRKMSAIPDNSSLARDSSASNASMRPPNFCCVGKSPPERGRTNPVAKPGPRAD